MNYFKCINEVKPSYIIDTEPVFSETVICDNSSRTDTLTLTQDYHNFDIIKFKAEDISSSQTTVNYFYTTPNMLDANKLYDGASFNFPGYGQFCCYEIISNTSFAATDADNVICIEVVGMKCTNGSLVETEVYNRGNIGKDSVTITTELNLLDFDLILTQNTSGYYKNNNIQDIIFIKSNNRIYGAENPPIKNNSNLILYMTSNTGYSTAWIHEHSIDEGPWLYVTGLKFIPNWDYYIEDRILTGSDSINTGLLPWKDDDTKARSWEICFKIETTSENASGGYVTTGNNTTPGVWLTRNGSNNSYVFMLDNNYIYNDTISNKDIKIVCNHEDTSNPYISLYVNGEKVLQKTENLSGYNTNRPIIIGAYSPYLSYFITGTVHYFGFRWLS